MPKVETVEVEEDEKAETVGQPEAIANER